MVCRQDIWLSRDRPNGRLKRHRMVEILHRCFRAQTQIQSDSKEPDGDENICLCVGPQQSLC